MSDPDRVMRVGDPVLSNSAVRNPGSSSEARTSDTLIFHRYRGQYVLGEVRFDSAANGILLPDTKFERSIKMVSHNLDVALVAAQ